AGDLAPDFTLPDLAGQPVRLSSFRGRQPVWLQFWASWAPPSQDDMALIQGLYRPYAAKGIEVLGVNAGEDRDVVARFIAEHGYGWHFTLDTSRTVADEFHVKGLPTYVLIDTDGRVRTVFVGRLDKAATEAALDALLATMPGGAAEPTMPAAAPAAQTLAGYTVHINPISADTNEITLSYTLLGPNGRPVRNPRVPPDGLTQWGPVELTDADGTPIPLDPKYPSDDEIVFDTSTLKAPPVMPLHLTMTLLTMGPGATVTPGRAPEPNAPVGPFDFTFQLPYITARRVAMVNQMIPVPNLHLTLDRVIVTPLSARAKLHLTTLDGSVPRYSLGEDVVMTAGPWSSRSGRRYGLEFGGNGEWTFSAYPSGDDADLLMQQDGEWTLTVPNMVRNDGQMLRGPWVFRFTVPAAQP
ncbi:MAG TPA: TlpA disulfide reductase family protein, partial [Chloroflexia bacterium]|nr:TlpA disulfide reductase family protein [Chloroflexia bacterium]